MSEDQKKKKQTKYLHRISEQLRKEIRFEAIKKGVDVGIQGRPGEGSGVSS